MFMTTGGFPRPAGSRPHDVARKEFHPDSAWGGGMETDHSDVSQGEARCAANFLAWGGCSKLM